MTKKRQRGALCAFALAGLAAAQGQSEDHTPIVFNGKAWANKQAFIDSPARCSTRYIGPDERAEIDAKLAASGAGAASRATAAGVALGMASSTSTGT